MYDRDTKLIHFGFREYDPFIGRWTAKDPILFAGGDSNLYGYVLGDPVGGVDALGVVCKRIWTNLIKKLLLEVCEKGRTRLCRELSIWMMEKDPFPKSQKTQFPSLLLK